MQPVTLDFIRGQLEVWQYVNRKCDHGTTFYLRDMQKPFGKPNLPFDGTCIKACFKKQLSALTSKTLQTDNPISFRVIDWKFVQNEFLVQLFSYLNDSAGYKLVDATNAFGLSSSEFQQEIAATATENIRTLASSKELFLVENNPEYFDGSVVLIPSNSTFYELRLGYYF